MRGLIDHHLHLHSWLHDWHPTPKLVAYALAVVSVAGVRAWPAAAASVGWGVLAMAAGRIPLTLVLRRTLPVVLFLATFVVLMGISNAWDVGLRIALQCMGILLLTTALLTTTPTLQIFRSLRVLRVPSRLVELLRLSYRLTYALGEELQTLRTAAACRGFELSAHPRQVRTIGRLAGALLIRGMHRSDRLYDAMLVRGYDGVARALPPAPMGRRDGGKLLVVVLPAVLLFVSRWWS